MFSNIYLTLWNQIKLAITAAEANSSQGIDLAQLTKEYKENRDSVIDMLVESCMKVDCEIPRVVKGNFEKMHD